MNKLSNINEPVVVVCAADDGYAMPLAVTVRSAIENLEKDRKIILFVIDGGIKEHNKLKILKSLNSEKCEVRFTTRPDDILGKIQVLTEFTIENVPLIGQAVATKHVSIATYYRLLIPELLPQEFTKAIYLDSDLLVLGDLSQLWDIDMGENYVLATHALLVQYVSSAAGLINYQELGIPADAKYFQPGVLVIDLEKWRADGISHKCVQYLQKNREYVRWHDSDVLNAILACKWGELEPRWNQMTEFYIFSSWEESPLSEEVYNEVLHSPYVVHFSSAAKPWNSRENHPFKHLFFKYLDMTAWSGWRLSIWRRGWRRLLREMKKLKSSAAKLSEKFVLSN